MFTGVFFDLQAFSILSMIIFGVLFCITLCNCIVKTSANRRDSYYVQPQVDPANMSAYPPPNTSQCVLPSGPSYRSANTLQYPSPSAPPYPPTQHASPSAPYYLSTQQPSHMPSMASASLKPVGNASADLLSYETAVAAHYTVPQPAPSGEPAKESKTTPVP